MADTTITFGKVVGNPTSYTWSQAYNAGGLFAVISLAKKDANHNLEKTENDLRIEMLRQKNEDHTLQILGKELLNTLEEEYFTLESKTINSIQTALEKTAQKIPKEVKGSILLSAIINGGLFAFGFGEGTILLIRKNKYTVLFKGNVYDKVKTMTGLLENNDYIILETEAFDTIITRSKIIGTALSNSPCETAEILSPLIHQKGTGEEAAIVILYKFLNPLPQIAEEALEESPPSFKFSFSKTLLSKIPYSYLILIVIISVLTISILYSLKKQQSSKTEALFQKVFSESQAKYDEGESLIGLNKNLANDDFKSALKIINDNKEKFTKGSSDEQKLSELAKKIDEALNNSSQNTQLNEASNHQMLNLENKDNSILYITSDDSNIYTLDSNGVTRIDKKTLKNKKIISNEDLGGNPAGFGIFYGNIYVADKSAKQIYKFASGSFNKANYFQGSFDISKAVSIAIDGSIWVLGSDGSIQKFTRGNQEGFSITGLDKPLKPTRIYTDPDSKNLYVLDNGNKRIVVLSKNGAFQEQYLAKTIANARDFSVSEKDKKIYILISNKLWQMDLK